MTVNRRKAPPISEAEEAAIQAGIARDPDAAELTAGELARLRPASEVLSAALLDGLTKRLPGQRGPRKRPPKELVSIRLDRDPVEHFREGGEGWQSRLNETSGRPSVSGDRFRRWQGGYEMAEQRRFPPPWQVEELASCFVVKDATGFSLTYVYFESDESRTQVTKLATRDEARRIAANIAKLPDLLSQTPQPDRSLPER